MRSLRRLPFLRLLFFPLPFVLAVVVLTVPQRIACGTSTTGESGADDNLADYVVPVLAGLPEIDVDFTDEPTSSSTRRGSRRSAS